MNSPANRTSPGLLIILATLVALGPLTIDMYLPAMPGMVDALGTTTSQVQLTISSYLLGFSLFHLVCGPLADRFGRKPVLIGGLVLYFLATLACAGAETIEGLIFYRFLQGVSACVGPTLGRAIARDLYGPKGAARALAYIAMIMALAPAVAPALGSLLLEFYSWSSIFVALAIYALIVLACVSLRLQESLPEVQPLHPSTIARNYLALLRSRHYMATTAASALMYSGMISFLSASSFIFIEMMDVPTRYFGALFLTTVLGYISGNAISTRLAIKRESEQVMWIGVQVSVVGGFAMLFATESWFHPLSVLAPMTLIAAALGIVLPHAMGAALRNYPHMAGTASALFGFIQMGLSSLAGAVVGFYLEADARPMIAVILVTSCTAWWLIRRLQRSDMA
jgi:DHA1 family bicyclomycin/chloramphenicol resistance-like MFS transporter